MNTPTETNSTPRNRYKLSDSVIAKLPPHDRKSKGHATEWADSECVGLRITAGRGGRKHWDFRYRFGGKKAILRLGEWPSVTTTEARRRANEMKAKLSNDIDPRSEREAARAIPTLAEFCEQEYVPHAKRTIRSARDSEQRLRVHVLPVLGTRRIDAVRRGDIERLHAGLLDKMTPASANRILASTKALLTHAVRLEVLAKSPAQGVRSHKENNARQRCLSGEELQRYLAAVAEEPNPVLRCFLRILLATGMRRGEALAARWENVSTEHRTLLLPQTKAGKARTILLNETAIAVLGEVPRVEGNPYVFPGTKAGTHLAEPKFAHERACKKAGISNLRIHDASYRLFSSSADFVGWRNVDEGVLLGGSGTLLPLPGTTSSGNTVSFDDTPGYAHLPAEFLPYIGEGGDDPLVACYEDDMVVQEIVPAQYNVEAEVAPTALAQFEENLGFGDSGPKLVVRQRAANLRASSTASWRLHTSISPKASTLRLLSRRCASRCSRLREARSPSSSPSASNSTRPLVSRQRPCVKWRLFGSPRTVARSPVPRPSATTSEYSLIPPPSML